MLLRNCPICAGVDAEILHGQDFVLLDSANYLPDSYNVVCCKECGFVYADTSADQAAYDKYYRELSKYEDDLVATGSGVSSQDLERMKKTVKDISGQVKDSECSILDIGCANGGLLMLLKEAGYERLTGLDPSPVCVKKIKEKNIKAFEGGLFDIPRGFTQEMKYDCIILSHVLEHVKDLSLAMENIVSFLKDDGTLYIEVPDAGEYDKNYIVPYYYFDCEHINHFDEKALKNLCRTYNLTFKKTIKKTFSVTDSCVYPAVGVFFKKLPIKDKAPLEKSEARKSVVEYVRLSKENDDEGIIDSLCESQEKIIVWGAGSFTQRLLRDTKLGKCAVVAILDNDSVKQGHKINNIPIENPIELKKYSYPVLVCSALHSEEISEEIRAGGYENNIISMSSIK